VLLPPLRRSDAVIGARKVNCGHARKYADEQSIRWLLAPRDGRSRRPGLLNSDASDRRSGRIDRRGVYFILPVVNRANLHQLLGIVTVDDVLALYRVRPVRAR